MNQDHPVAQFPTLQLFSGAVRMKTDLERIGLVASKPVTVGGRREVFERTLGTQT